MSKRFKAKAWILYDHKVAHGIAAGGSTPVEDSIQKVSILRDSTNGKEEITIKINEKDIYKHDFNYKGSSEYLNHIQVKLD